MWSLVNAPMLAFDAVRLPTGAAFAGDLLGALSLDARTLGVLDVLARELPPLETAGAPGDTALAGLASLRAGLAAPDGPILPAGLADRLARAPLGDRSGLAAFVRDDVLGWTQWHDGAHSGRRWSAGVELVGEVVTAAHAGDVDDHPRRAAWERLRPVWPASTGLPNDVDGRLDRLAERLTVPVLEALEAQAPRHHRAEQESWAELVHAATQVLFVTDRLRAAAIAQLRAALTVRTVHPGPVPLDAAAVISGAVHAWAAQDLLDDARYDALVSPLEAVLGAS